MTLLVDMPSNGWYQFVKRVLELSFQHRSSPAPMVNISGQDGILNDAIN